VSDVCACGKELGRPSGRGRPRKRCRECASDKSALAKQWRADHSDEVEAYNESRRVVHSFIYVDGVPVPNPSPRPKSRVH
jgi:hypothetical protein